MSKLPTKQKFYKNRVVPLNVTGVVPVDAPVLIEGTLYKKGLRGYIYYFYEGTWIRSSLDENILYRKMLALNKDKKKQGLAPEFGI